MTADLTERSDYETLVERAEEALGPLDILVNNAGLEFGGAFISNSLDEIDAIAEVNLKALMVLTRQALPGMLARRRGHVVNIASLAGKTTPPSLATYVATKHGVVGFTHSLRAEHGSGPVSFSAICPAFVGREGMYGRLEADLPEPPWYLRPFPPERVGRGRDQRDPRRPRRGHRQRPPAQVARGALLARPGADGARREHPVGAPLLRGGAEGARRGRGDRPAEATDEKGAEAEEARSG